MKDLNYTKQERAVRWWLRFLFVFFLVEGIVYTIKPNYILQYLDNIGYVFFNFQSFPLESPRFEIWWIMTLGFKWSLSYCAFQGQRHWLRFHTLMHTIIVGQAIITLGLTDLAFFHPTHFFYIVAAVLNGLVFVTSWYAYVTAINSRTYWSYTTE